MRSWRSDRPVELDVLVQSAWRSSRSQAAAEQAGLSEVQVAAVLAPEPLEAVVLERGGDVDGLGSAVGAASAILLFISVSAFGAYVSDGVVEEKATAVVEVLLSHVRPAHLLTGKVLGIGVVALVQFSAALASALLILAVASLLRLAGVVYARTVLHRGSRLHWREALRAGSATTVPQ